MATIEAVPAILPKTVKEHQKQVVKVVSTAGEISRTTRSVPLKPVRKGVKVATAIVIRNDQVCYPGNSSRTHPIPT